MAALTSGDWTVTVLDRRKEHGGGWVTRCSMALATVGTYPSGGIPVPTVASNYGLKRQMTYLNIYDPGSTQVHLAKYSATGQTIRLYQQQGLSSGTVGNLIELATTASGSPSGTAIVLYVEAHGD